MMINFWIETLNFQSISNEIKDFIQYTDFISDFHFQNLISLNYYSLLHVTRMHCSVARKVLEKVAKFQQKVAKKVAKPII